MKVHTVAVQSCNILCNRNARSLFGTVLSVLVHKESRNISLPRNYGHFWPRRILSWQVCWPC